MPINKTSKILHQNNNTYRSIGLLKRGLGGISIEDNNVSTTAMYLKSKIPKITTNNHLIFLDSTNTHSISKQPFLKPKLWNRFLLHNTNIQAQPSLHRHQHRQFKLTGDEEDAPKQQTLTLNLEWCLADAGLFNSRRFRVNWSHVHNTFTTADNTSKIQLKMPTSTSWWLSTSTSEAGTSSKFNSLKENCKMYLQTQLELTEFVADASIQKNRLPLLKAKYGGGNELIRQMCACSQQIRNNIGKKC